MTDFDFKHLINAMSNSHANMVRVGMAAAEDRMRPAIHALEREFFASQIDPDTKMKTSLQVAICHVLALVPSSITEKVTEYADTKIKRDQLARHEGRPDQDMGPNGQRLRTGT